MRIKFLTLFFTLLNLSMWANKTYDVREDGNSFSYVDTLYVTPDIAYNNAQSWIVKSSASYKGSVQFEDREQKKMIIKSGVDYPYDISSNTESFLVFDMTIELKEGRFRLKFENIKQYTLIHSVDFGFGETGEDESECDVVTLSCYDKNVVSGIAKFRYEEEYENNKVKLQELKDKQTVVKKKKELTQIETEIRKIESRQKSLDDWRQNYTKINTTINNYIANFSKHLNTNDDF